MEIYRITNKLDGKVYIGKSEGLRVEHRWNYHTAAAQRGHNWCPHFYNALRKHGPENFKFEVLFRATSRKELDLAERFFIFIHQSHLRENGYNMTLGGEGGIPTEEARKNMSRARLGYVPSAEMRRKNSLANSGKKRSTLTCARIKASKQGYNPGHLSRGANGQFTRTSCV